MGKSGGVKISKVKRRNHLSQKLHVRKKKRNVKNSNAVRGHKHVLKSVSKDESEPIKEDYTDQMIGMMDEEDIDYLMKGYAKQSLDIMKMIRSTEREPSCRSKKNVQNNECADDKWEKLYESELNQGDQKQTKLLLPIKTNEGIVVQSREVDVMEEERKNSDRQIAEEKKKENRKKKLEEKKRKRGEEQKEETAGEEGESMEHDEIDDELKLLKEQRIIENVNPNDTLQPIDLLVFREEILQKYKFKIGLLSSGLLEAPEMKVRNFKLLLHMLDDETLEFKITIRRLVILSLLEIFRDILPSYQIKHQETNVKLKKQNFLLINYEKSLLKAYKTYLQRLEKMASIFRSKDGNKANDPKEKNLGILALRCLSELLKQNPYFNFSVNIGQTLVLHLNSKCPEARGEALKGLQLVLKEDKKGQLSLQIVRRINHLVQKSNHSVCPEVLSVLLALRLKDINLDAEKESEIKEKKFMNRKQKLLSMSKRERKRSKRLEELEKEMLETKAEENKNVKHKNLTEVTKVVFTIFFRVLKQAPTSKLLSITLEGLAKFAHCINLEFFQDLVNVLDSVLVNQSLSNLQQLHCVETVFNILSGQGEVLNIDPLRFYTRLYECLLEVHAGCTSGNAITVLRILEKAIIARRRKVSFQRLLAFTKRLCTLAVHLMHGDAIGYLGVVRNVMMLSKSCETLLDTDTSLGSGFYLPELSEPEYCGATSTVLWELVLLSRHYHPYVKEMACLIMNSEGKETISPELAKLSPTQMAETFDCSQMVFRPAVPLPHQATPHTHRGRLILTNDDFTLYLQNIENSVSDNMLFDTASECNVAFNENDDLNLQNIEN